MPIANTNYRPGMGNHVTSGTGTSRLNDIRYSGGGGNAASISWANQHIVQPPKDPYAGMYEAMAAAMEAQAAAQADYMAQMSELQQQALLQQEEAAKAANIESAKSAADYTVANADDVARKQMLRRGLMSTYTRYGGQNSGAGAKSTKLGG